MSTRIEATIEDLYRVPDNRKAEIVDGEIDTLSPTGFLPGQASLAICISLKKIQRQAGGWAIGDNVGFLVDLPNRKSFSPDAAFYRRVPSGMKFLEGAPEFAVEIRSEHDYGAAAETAIARKRADYFAAGTLVVWDVDLLSDDVVRVYRAADPTVPVLYHRGESAEAEPAVPGWTMRIDELFE